MLLSSVDKLLVQDESRDGSDHAAHKSLSPRHPLPRRNGTPAMGNFVIKKADSRQPNALSADVPAFIAAAATNAQFVWRNWARIHSVHPAYYHRPTTTAEIQGVVRYAHEHRQKVRVAGCGHSPSDIVLCSEHIIDLMRFNRVLSVSSAARTITMQAGVSVGAMLSALAEHDLTLPTTGTIGDQTVGGILGTGTHGTGTGCRIMSDNVVALALLTADGRLLELSPDSQPALFSAALVNLGALGIVTELTMKAVPAFQLTVEEEVRDFAHVVTHLEAIVESTPYPRLHWCPHLDKVVVHRMHEPDGTSAEERAEEAMRASFLAFLLGPWVASVRPALSRAMGAVNFFVMHGLYQVALFLALYVHSLTPVINLVFHTWQHPWSRASTTAPAREQLMFDCGVSQHVTEWAIPREAAVDALMSLHHLIHVHRLQCDFPIEVRFVAADDILLSPAYGRASCYINIISYRPYGRDHPMQHTFFHLFEEMMTALGGRPHWAKPFGAKRPELAKMYDGRLEQFEAIRRQLDPHGMFVNSWIERVLNV